MHEKIDSAIESLLNNVLETINLEALVNNYETDNDNKFKKKNKFRKYDNNNNSVSLNSLSLNNSVNSLSLNNSINSISLAKDNFILSRTIKNTYVNTKKKTTEDKSKHEAIKSNIKTILNKLSPSNYSKLEHELINISLNIY
jgi:DNA-binding transcriptional regulator YhcF (GntR family)